MSVMFLPLRLIPLPVQCVVVATVLDLAFSRDASLRPHLQGLQGKAFRITVTDMQQTFYLGFRGGKAWVHPKHEGGCDVDIEASTTGFARMCFTDVDPDDLVFEQVLKLSGDSESMLRFKKLLAAADLDWEQELRAAFGEFFGSRVAKAAHALVAAEQRVQQRSQQALQDYLAQMHTPNQERLQTWQAGVEQLAHNISRHKGKLTRLEHRLDHLTS